MSKKWYVCTQVADEMSVWVTELTDEEYKGVCKFLNPNDENIVHKDMYSGSGSISPEGYETRKEALENVYKY